MRITGGELCGLRLQAPRGRAIRPTSDRVRKSMFDLLGPDASGDWVLDLFAGTGALGIEALSRGFHWAVFVENDHTALETLWRNLRSCRLVERAVVVNLDVSRYLSAGPKQTFSLILADPPYRLGWPEKLLKMIGVGGWLDEDGYFLLEHEAGWRPSGKSGSLGLWKNRQYGSTAVAIYRSRLHDEG